MSHGIQTISANKEKASCNKCGANILDILNMAYEEKFKTDPRYREELCHCRFCGTKFIIHYDLFDKNGHVYSRVFGEDINNPEFKWQDLLVKEQIDEIAAHLSTCEVCKNRLSEEMLSDALLSSVIHKDKNQ
jgi:uncharacterized protein with PIN domain